MRGGAMIKNPAMTMWERVINPLKRAAAPVEELAFSADFLSQLERLRVAALKALGGGLHEGHRLGAYKGGQLEFHGHRDYSPGDELRYLDWNSFARLDRPYIKEFAREESGVLHIMIDASASMRLGAPSKWIFAARVAALFAHVALSSNDSVHFQIFKGSNQLEHFPTRKSKTTTQACLAFLQSVTVDQRDVDGETGMSPNSHVLRGAVGDFLKRSPARGGVLIVGDFWQDESEIAESVSRLTQAGFDVSALHTLAEEEIEPGGQGELRVSSIEDGATADLWFGNAMQSRYAEELEKHRAMVEAIVRKRGGNYVFAPSATSIEKVLIASLRQRRWLI